MPMDEREILETVIYGEISSYEFYKQAGATFDEEVKKTFSELAEAEKKHRNWLEMIY